MKDCIFCKIAGGEIPAEFEHKGENVVVFADINPQAPIHLLIVPKKHIQQFAAVGPDEKNVWDEMVGVARELIGKHNLVEKGYRIVLNGGPAAQVDHLHMHLLGEVKDTRF